MKRNFLIGVLSLTLLLVFTGASFAQFGSISGSVTDDSTGLPIMGAHVWAKADTTQPGGYGFDITDSSGFYMIDSIYAGEFLVFANAQGYEEETYPESVMVVAGQNTPDIDFALTLAAGETGSVSGIVTDEVTGYPIEGAGITLSGIYGVWYTDSTGYYLCESIPPGAYFVNAHAPGYYRETYPDSVIVVGGHNTPDIEFALTPIGEMGSISGMVTDEGTGLPLPMAHVWAYDSITQNGAYAWTDTAGLYLIQNLAAGQYLVEVHRNGYEDEVYPESVIVEEGQDTPDINFSLTSIGSPEFGSISGMVTNEVTGYPIQGAAITLSGIYGVWYTDSTGHYMCDSIPVGGYWVTAYAAGYHQETYPDSVIVFEGQNTPDIDLALTPTGSPEYGSISGRVIDQVTGLPIIGAHLVATGLDTYCFGETWSDSNGYYIIEDLCAGIWQVQASKPGYYTQVYPDTVIVVEGQTTPSIDFALTPLGEMGSISGKVTDKGTGLPLPMAHVLAYDSTHIIGDVWTDTAGLYLMQSLPAGQYIVAVHKDGYEDEVYPESVIVNEGQNTTDIDFALNLLVGNGSISGRVVDQVTSLPIIGAHLVATGLDTYCFGEAWSDSNGYYVIEGLCAGIWQVQASKPGYHRQVYPDTLTVLEGQTTLDIDFALTPIVENGSISGRVGDEQTGLPLIEAHLVATGLDNYCFGEAWSDTGGNYTILDLCPGIYQVRVCYMGYVPEIYQESVIVESGKNTYPVNFDLIPNEEPVSISGEVTDQMTSDPIEGVHVIGVEINSWCIAHAWTNSYGNYILQGLWPGTWVVRGEKHGYFPGVYPDSLILVEGQDTPDIDFTLTPEGDPLEFGSISGRVTDEESGLPIVMAEITVTGLYCIWYTDTAGYYFCDSLPSGSHEVNAQKQGYISETYPDSVIVMAGENTPDIDLALTPIHSGNVNGDDEINVSDVVSLINYLFKNGSAPKPVQSGDVNCDNNIDIIDVVYLINYLFKDGPPLC